MGCLLKGFVEVFECIGKFLGRFGKFWVVLGFFLVVLHFEMFWDVLGCF